MVLIAVPKPPTVFDMVREASSDLDVWDHIGVIAASVAV